MITSAYVFKNGLNGNGVVYEVGIDSVLSIFTDKDVAEPVITIKYADRLVVYKGVPFWYTYQKVQGETK